MNPLETLKKFTTVVTDTGDFKRLPTSWPNAYAPLRLMP
jgi:hypothetical protein